MADMTEQRWTRRIFRMLLAAALHLLFLTRPTLRFRSQPPLRTPCVLAIFHEELIPAVAFLESAGFVTLSSDNHVGHAMTSVLRPAGIGQVFGSSHKRSTNALYELTRRLQQGQSVVITVDGARGPRQVVKPGAALLARKAGVPLYLARFHCRGFRLPSWDRTLVPLLFSEVTADVTELPPPTRAVKNGTLVEQMTALMTGKTPHAC